MSNSGIILCNIWKLYKQQLKKNIYVLFKVSQTTRIKFRGEWGKTDLLTFKELRNKFGLWFLYTLIEVWLYIYFRVSFQVYVTLFNIVFLIYIFLIKAC